jgi:hypothetical protein
LGDLNEDNSDYFTNYVPKHGKENFSVFDEFREALLNQTRHKKETMYYVRRKLT